MKRTSDQKTPGIKCTLCESVIADYSTTFNHLTLDESHSAEICQDCVEKIIKWKQETYATLFPTPAIKRRFRKP